MNSLILGIDLGGTKTGVCAGRADGTLLARRRMPTQTGDGPDAWLPRVKSLALEVLAEAGATPADVARIGISAPGPLNIADRVLDAPPNMPGWVRVPLLDMIEGALGRPAVMNNDANACALAEYYYGSHRGVGDLVYLTHSTGIGGGILTGQGVYRGADSYAGEIGHLNIRPDGPDCLCGSNGCFERMCCGLWLERDNGRSAHALMQEPAFVRRYVVDLARGLKAAIMLLNPARIVIGGGISKAGDALFVPLRNELGRQITSWSRARIDVIPAALGDDSVLWGAYELAQEAMALEGEKG